MPEGSNAPNGLAIDPAKPERLYLATWARAAGVHGDGGGVYLSEDAGKTWRLTLDRDRHVYDVTIDPRNSSILYATGSNRPRGNHPIAANTGRAFRALISSGVIA